MAFRITVHVVSTDEKPIKIFYITIDQHQTMQLLRGKVTERFCANYPELVSPETTFGRLRSVKGVDFCDEDRISDLYSADEEKVVLVTVSSSGLKRSIEDDPEVLVQSTDPALPSRSGQHRDADGFVIPNTPKRLRLSDASVKLADRSALHGNAPPTPTSRSLSNRGVTPISGQRPPLDPGTRQTPLAPSSDVSLRSSDDTFLYQRDGLARPTPFSDVSNRLSATPSAFSRLSGSQERFTPPNKNDSWNKEEDAQLLEGTRLGLSTSQIVKKYAINRSASAARSRRLLLEKKHADLQASSNTSPPSLGSPDDNDAGIAQSTRSQQWQPADELKLKHAFRLGLDPGAITRQYFFRTRTFDSVNARYQSLEQAYNQSRRHAQDWPKEGLAVTGWGENENGRLRRAYMNSLNAETAHRRFFQTFSLAIVQSKYKAYSKQLTQAGLDRTVFDPESPPILKQTPVVAVKSEISSSVIGPDRSSPCIRAAPEVSLLYRPISIPSRPAEQESDDDNARPLKKSKTEGGQTFLNFKRSKGKGCDLPLADIRAELNQKYQQALSAVSTTRVQNRELSDDLIEDGAARDVTSTAVASVDQQVAGDEDDDFYSAVSEVPEASDEAFCFGQDETTDQIGPRLLRASSQEACSSRPSTTESFFTAPEHDTSAMQQNAARSKRSQRLYLEAVVVPAAKIPVDAIFVHDYEDRSDVHNERNIDYGGERDEEPAPSVVVTLEPLPLQCPEFEVDANAITVEDDASIFDIPDDSPKTTKMPNPWSRLNRVPSTGSMSRASSLARVRQGGDTIKTPARAVSVMSKRLVSVRRKQTPKPSSRPFTSNGYVSDSQTSFEEVTSTQESWSTQLAEQYKRKYVVPYPKPPKPPVEVVLSSDDEDDDQPLPSALILLQSSTSKSTPRRTPRQTAMKTPAKSIATPKRRSTDPRPVTIPTSTPVAGSPFEDNPDPQETHQPPERVQTKSNVREPEPAAMDPIETHPHSISASSPASGSGDNNKTQALASARSPELAQEDPEMHEPGFSVTGPPEPQTDIMETRFCRFPASTVEQTTLHDFYNDNQPVYNGTTADNGTSTGANDDANSVASISDWISPLPSSLPKPMEHVLPLSSTQLRSPLVENVPETDFSASKSFIDYLSDEDDGDTHQLDVLTTQQLDTHIDDISDDVFAILGLPAHRAPPPNKASPRLKLSLKKKTAAVKKARSPDKEHADLTEPRTATMAHSGFPSSETLFSGSASGSSDKARPACDESVALSVPLPTSSLSKARPASPRLKSALKTRTAVNGGSGHERNERRSINFGPIQAERDSSGPINRVKVAEGPVAPKVVDDDMASKHDIIMPATIAYSKQPSNMDLQLRETSTLNGVTPERIVPAATKSTEALARSERTSSSRKRARRKARRDGRALRMPLAQPVRAGALQDADTSAPGHAEESAVEEQKRRVRKAERKRKKKAERKKQKRIEKEIARVGVRVAEL